MSKIKSIMFFPNGNTGVTDKTKQLSKFQGSWLLKYIEHITSLGGVVDKDVEIILPNGNNAQYMPEHNNWRIFND